MIRVLKINRSEIPENRTGVEAARTSWATQNGEMEIASQSAFAATVIDVKGKEPGQAGEERQASPFLTIALIMTNNLRIQAMSATFFSLPRLSSFS